MTNEDLGEVPLKDSGTGWKEEVVFPAVTRHVFRDDEGRTIARVTKHTCYKDDGVTTDRVNPYRLEAWLGGDSVELPTIIADSLKSPEEGMDVLEFIRARRLRKEAELD